MHANIQRETDRHTDGQRVISRIYFKRRRIGGNKQRKEFGTGSRLGIRWGQHTQKKKIVREKHRSVPMDGYLGRIIGGIIGVIGVIL